jgi:O-antigen ligase
VSVRAVEVDAPASFEGEAAASALARTLLAVGAMGIPLDVLLATRFGGSTLVLGLPLILGGGWQVVRSGVLRPLPPAIWLIALFVAWSVLSLAWSVDREAGMKRTKTYGQLLAFVWLSWQVLRTERDLKVVLAGFLGGCAIAAGSAWRAFLSGELWPDVTRYAAEAFDPNDMAVTLALGIPIAAYLTLGARHRWGSAALLYVPVAASAIVLSGSRAGLLTAAVAVLAVTAWMRFRRVGALVLVVALLGAGLAVGWQNIPDTTRSRLATLQQQLAGTMGGRTAIWRAGAAAWLDDPVAGVGTGGFAAAVAPRVGTPEVAHNTPLSVAVDVGLVGLVLFLGAFHAVLRSVARSGRNRRFFAWSLLLAWLFGTSSLTWEHRKTTWFVLLAGAAVAALRPEEPGEP